MNHVYTILVLLAMGVLLAIMVKWPCVAVGIGVGGVVAALYLIIYTFVEEFRL